MAGMKPKIICSQCGSGLARTDSKCPSCGVAIDWTDGDTPVQGTESVRNKSRDKNAASKWSSKSIIGVLVVVLLLIVGYEVLTTKRPADESVQQPASQPMSGAMQMPPQVQELINRVEANPEDMVSTLELSNILHDNHLYDKAIQYYQKYLERAPKDADARVDMGICYKELGNFAEAKKEMKTALQYVPKHLFAHFNLGIVCLSEGNINESNGWFKKTVDLSPTSEVGMRAQQLLSQHKSQSQKINK